MGPCHCNIESIENLAIYGYFNDVAARVDPAITYTKHSTIVLCFVIFELHLNASV